VGPEETRTTENVLTPGRPRPARRRDSSDPPLLGGDRCVQIRGHCSIYGLKGRCKFSIVRKLVSSDPRRPMTLRAHRVSSAGLWAIFGAVGAKSAYQLWAWRTWKSMQVEMKKRPRVRLDGLIGNLADARDLVNGAPAKEMANYPTVAQKI
jgi:hypothetical protein